MSFECKSYVLVCHSYFIRISLVCACMASLCHSYVTGLCSYVIRISLVCTRMSSICHSYVFVYHPCVTFMLLLCTRMSSVCHWYVLVCHPYVTRVYSYVIRISFVCVFTMNPNFIEKDFSLIWVIWAGDKEVNTVKHLYSRHLRFMKKVSTIRKCPLYRGLNFFKEKIIADVCLTIIYVNCDSLQTLFLIKHFLVSRLTFYNFWLLSLIQVIHLVLRSSAYHHEFQ